MSTVANIRKTILKISQAQFAELTSTTQATVSRWENGELSPDLTQLAAIRAEVLRRGEPWDDAWFFKLPTSQAQQENAA